MEATQTRTQKRFTLKHFTRLMIALLCSLVLLSIYQYTTLYLKGVVDSILNISFVLAIVHHIGYTSIVGLILVAPYNLMENIKPRLGFKFTFIMIVLVLLIETILIGYYTTTFVPLGSDLMGYSLADIKATVFSSGGISFVQIMAILVVCAVFYGIYRVTVKFYHHISKMFPFTIILFSLFVATLFTEGKPINENKTQYLIVNLFQSSTENTKTYEANVEYPLLREDEGVDVLGEYFDLKDEKPNIVFVVVEGLGRDFVGEGAEYGGFTPFLDSLTTKSLYWENCLSNTGRTYGVMPSLLGSLPFGKRGFMELENMPNKFTLFSLLKNNGYHTSSMQGTNTSFDNLDNFLLSEDVDFVLNKSSFEGSYEMQRSGEGGSWGYPDKELFKKALSLDRNYGKPKMDVYMTITTHEPFMPPKQDYYESKVKQLLSKKSFKNGAKRVIEKNDNVFASLMYTDDALKWFFEANKRKKGYENTIFIVTGDHRLIPIPQRNMLSRFHVPLMIYSPMLKSTKKMSGITSHFDVAPTLVRMLQNKYNIAVPEKVAWVGSSLDMNEKFSGTKNIPLMRNKNELKDFVYNDYFYANGETYQIKDGINLTGASASKGKEIKVMLDEFKALNDYVTNNNKLIPDDMVIYKMEKEVFTEEEKVWIDSKFNGENYDSAYQTARELAFNKERDESLLLCRYILSRVPSHIDTKILSGRVNAWEGNYDKAIEIFKACIKTNPNYGDPYAALLDVYFWSDQNEKAILLFNVIDENKIKEADVIKKIKRAYQKVKESAVTTSSNPYKHQEIEAYIKA